MMRMRSFQRTRPDAVFAPPRLPDPEPGDAGKIVTVNGAETGYELDPPAPGTSSPSVSWMFANLAGDTLLTGSTAAMALADPAGSTSFEGTDLSWDSGTPSAITVETNGLYAVYIDVRLAQSADADGNAAIAAAFNASWTSAAGSLGGWLYATANFALRPSAGTTTQLDSGAPLHMPPVWMEAGSTVEISAMRRLVAGSVTLKANSGLAVVRIG